MVWNIGYITDAHWGYYGSNGLAADEPTLKATLDGFVAEMNPWADAVVLGGDNTHSTPQSTKSEAQQTISDFRTYLENEADGGGLDPAIPIYPVWGNHEYIMAASWGGGWSYDPWGISATSETYYSFESPDSKAIVLNNAYGTDDKNGSFDLPPGELSWLQSELRSTSKPVVIFSHIPISPGGGTQYDQLDSDNQFRLPSLLSRYDNVVCCLFGHSHHNQSYTPSIPDKGYEVTQFRQPLVQSYYGIRHFYQHFPHRLGVSAEADQWNPYAKVRVGDDGRVWIEESYAGEGTGKREHFRFDGFSPALPEERWSRNFDAYVSTPLGSLDMFDTSGAGSLAHRNDGFVEFSSGATAGDTFDAVFRRANLRAIRGKYSMDRYLNRWPDTIWRVGFNLPDRADMNAWITWGGVGASERHIGFRIVGGNIYGTACNGTDRTQIKVDSNPETLKYLSFRHFGDLGAEGMVQFYANEFVGGPGTPADQRHISLNTDLPQDGTDMAECLLHVNVETSTDAVKSLRLSTFDMFATPVLQIQT